MAFDFDAFEARLNQRFNAIEARLDRLEGPDGLQGLHRKFDRLHAKVGILHEDVKADFRFSLEAIQGVQEQLEARIAAEGQATR